MSIVSHGYRPAKVLSSIRKRKNWFDFSFFSRSKKIKKRDFFQKSFRNPYFLKDRLPRRTRAPRLKVFIGLIAILGIVVIFFFHPFFSINQVEVSGGQRISQDDIKTLVIQELNQKRLFFLDNHNIFLIDLSEIKKIIQDRYVLESLDISKDFPQGLKILLKEKIPQLIFQNENKYYLVDEDGKITQEIKLADLGSDLFLNIPLFQKISSSTIDKINIQVIPVATEQFINFLFQNIPKKTQTNLTYAIIMDEEGSVLNLVTSEGWKIIVDRQSDWNKQIQVLSVILRDKIKNNRSKLHYIDVRYENRSYYQ